MLRLLQAAIVLPLTTHQCYKIMKLNLFSGVYFLSSFGSFHFPTERPRNSQLLKTKQQQQHKLDAEMISFRPQPSRHVASKLRTGGKRSQLSNSSYVMIPIANNV